MKPIIKAGLVFTGLCATLSFAISLVLVRSLFLAVPFTEKKENLRYHFALYVPQERNSFFSDIIEGARRSAAEQNALLSVHTLDRDGIVLHMAAYIGVDGIVIYPNNDDSVTLSALERLRSRSIPLILSNHNVPADQPWPFIGTNNFDLGKKAASLLAQKEGESLSIAIVYSEKTPSIYAERELVEMGIHSVIGRSLSGPLFPQRTDLNPRDAEKIIYHILQTNPSINTVIFTDTNDTLAGTQAIIDLNLVGRMRIIGFGSDPTILSYIQRGIIAGSLSVRPEHIGYQSVRSLVELVSGGYTSSSVDTGIDVITVDNLQLFRTNRERTEQ